MNNPANHYHIINETNDTRFVELCEHGEICEREDACDILGKNVLFDKTEYKIVQAYKTGDPIPVKARHILSTTNTETDRVLHYYELSGV